MTTFKERLKQLREERDDLTQRKLAKILSVSSSTVGMWETGERKPDIDTITELAKFFNCTTDYLLGLSDQRRPANSETVETDIIDAQIAANMEAQYGKKPSPELVELIREVIQEELDKKDRK